MTPDKANLGKSAFFLKPSPIPKPLKGTYMTCTPAAHTKQVGFERLLARLQPVRDASGAASFANPALVTLGVSTFCGGPSLTDRVALKSNRLGFIVDLFSRREPNTSSITFFHVQPAQKLSCRLAGSGQLASCTPFGKRLLD